MEEEKRQREGEGREDERTIQLSSPCFAAAQQELVKVIDWTYGCCRYAEEFGVGPKRGSRCVRVDRRWRE